jgi:hypothetical protein
MLCHVLCACPSPCPPITTAQVEVALKMAFRKFMADHALLTQQDGSPSNTRLEVRHACWAALLDCRAVGRYNADAHVLVGVQLIYVCAQASMAAAWPTSTACATGT